MVSNLRLATLMVLLVAFPVACQRRQDVGREPVVQIGHARAVSACRLTPDGRGVHKMSCKTGVHIWSCYFLGNGNRAAAMMSNGQVRSLDASTVRYRRVRSNRLIEREALRQ